MTCRALLDPGSQSDFVTSKLIRKLGLPSCLSSTQISGIEKAKAESTNKARLRLSSRNSHYIAEASSLMLSEITEKIPQVPIDRSKIIIPNGIELADPKFHAPGKIMFLLKQVYFGETSLVN